MKDKLVEIIKLVKQEANQIAENAAYGGERHDGGASQMLKQAEFFEYGLAKLIPPDWKKYEIIVNNQADPEYETYTRLKQKFGK